ncbi:MAG: tetratricopeptide repeat protein [Planctomycetota bacterium]
MASKINTPFVAALTTGLLLVAVAVVGTAVFVLKKSGDEYEALGDAALAEGEIEDAIAFYGSAVAHDPTNMGWLEKWSDAIHLGVPEGERAYQERFIEYRSAVREMARVAGDDVERHTRFIDMYFRQASASGWNSQSFAAFNDQVREVLLFFMDPEAPELGAIRRYRGLASADLASAGLADDETIELGRADLELALEADPSDQEAAFALSLFDIAGSNEARTNRRSDLADELFESATTRLSTFAASNRPAVLVELQSVVLSADAAIRRIRSETSDAVEREDLLAQAMPPLRARYNDTVETLLTIPLSEVPIRAWDRLDAADRLTRSGGDRSRLVEVLEARAAEDPSRFRLELMLGRALQREGRFADSLEVFSRVAERRPERVSVNGLLLIGASAGAQAARAESAAQAWESAETDEARAEALEVTRSTLDELRRRLGTEAPEVIKGEARLAFAEGDLEFAQRKILDYRDTPRGDSDISTHWLLGQIAFRRSQLGTAEQSLERVLEMRPGHIGASSVLAEIKLGLVNYEEARELAEGVLSRDPDNRTAADIVRRLDLLTGEVTSDDPVIAALIEADRLARGDGPTPGDVGAAIDSLRAVRERLNDPRISVSLIRLLGGVGRDDEAREVLEDALAAFPEETTLVNLARIVNAESPADALVIQIRENGTDPLKTAMDVFQVYVNAGRRDDAKAALAEAASVSPTDERVLDARLGIAASENDIETVEEVVRIASENDVDGVGGRTYRARLLSLQGENERAVDVISEAAELRPTEVQMWDLLARYQRTAGDLIGSAESFETALQMDPTRVDMLRTYISTLFDLGRFEDALSAARANTRAGRADPGFIEQWVELEARYGTRSVAIAQREQLRSDFPDNRVNSVRLAGLYMDDARWEDAERLIDELREESDDLAAANLAARWEADQGDLAAANVVFSDFIIRQDLETLNAEPFIAFGRFMISRGVSNIGLRALEDGREFQDPDVREADLALSQAYLDLGRFEAAAELLRSLLDSGTSEDDRFIRLGLSEALVRSDRPAEAREVLDGLPEDAARSLETLLLRAKAAAMLEDTRAAEELHDAAVAAAPDSALAYTERARWLATQAGRTDDALADITTAIELAPSDLSPRLLRASIRRSRDDRDGMLEDLVAAVRLNPDRRELVTSVIEELITQERDSDAAALARDLYEQRPGELRLIVGTAESFGRRGNWRRAAELYELAWRQTESRAIIPAFVESLVSQDPPATARGRTLLREVAAEIDSSPELLMSRARLSAADDRIEDAERDASRAFDLSIDQPGGLPTWYASAQRVFDDDADRLIEFLERAEARVRSADRAVWMRANVMLSQASTQTDGEEVLASLIERSSDDGVRRDAAISLGAHLYENQDFQGAVEAWGVALEQFPDDWELLNNLAYVYARELPNLDLAQDYAQRATETNPEAPNAWDTLGLVRLLLGDLEGAEAALLAGLERTVPTSLTSVPLRIHLAQLRLEQGQTDEAATLLGSAEALANALGESAAAYQTELDDLRERLGGAQ